MINELSIIIPTMWRSEKLQWMLPRYFANPWVHEVILIDNAPKDRPDWLCLRPEDSPKLRMVTKGLNIYVNPAWNWGVELAKSDYIALVNDDLLINRNHLWKMMESGRHSLLDFDVIGMAEENFHPERVDSIIGCFNITEKGHGWGTFMFLLKEKYVRIPDDLKIWRGDHIQLIHNKAAEMRGVCITTNMSETIKSDDRLTSIGRADMRIFKMKYAGKDLRSLSV